MTRRLIPVAVVLSALGSFIACGSGNGAPKPNDDDVVPGTAAYASNLTPDPDTGLDGWTAAAIATADGGSSEAADDARDAADG